MSRVKNVGRELLNLKLEDETSLSHSRSLDAVVLGTDAVWLFPVGAVCGDGGVTELIATTAHSDTLAGIPWRQGRQQDIS